ncbi:hypothetical protein Pst134EA_011833 [Puccinia striiformis f. sp. tritici]|uniref:hypothetical protein n=1 Tax=Puccinia striiformis f. sp. tritici TaxID=168172 RepID=UPI002008CEBD|nr:hypothetical protein Pst134EA_011833 [Puccinia striiformis f. sp. tritici]KAH9468204.1 hypothetical protein Pst134EA_011833 [Puccinia striiformis f. sp. tritici]
MPINTLNFYHQPLKHYAASFPSSSSSNYGIIHPQTAVNPLPPATVNLRAPPPTADQLKGLNPRTANHLPATVTLRTLATVNSLEKAPSPLFKALLSSFNPLKKEKTTPAIESTGQPLVFQFEQGPPKTSRIVRPLKRCIPFYNSVHDGQSSSSRPKPNSLSSKFETRGTHLDEQAQIPPPSLTQGMLSAGNSVLLTSTSFLSLTNQPPPGGQITPTRQTSANLNPHSKEIHPITSEQSSPVDVGHRRSVIHDKAITTETPKLDSQVLKPFYPGSGAVSHPGGVLSERSLPAETRCKPTGLKPATPGNEFFA